MNYFDYTTASPQLVLDDLGKRESRVACIENELIRDGLIDRSTLKKLYRLAILKNFPISTARDMLDYCIHNPGYVTKCMVDLRKLESVNATSSRIPNESVVTQSQELKPAVDSEHRMERGISLVASGESHIQNVLKEINNVNSEVAYWEREQVASGGIAIQTLKQIYKKGEDKGLTLNQCRETVKFCAQNPWLVNMIVSEGDIKNSLWSEMAGLKVVNHLE